MRIEVNGVRIFFDVEGAKLVPDGPVLREKPTLILLHGGPGADHSAFKPAFSQFDDICQVIYIDHRGNGRSDREPRVSLNLAQWGDDVYEFCRALEIEKPIVMGGSFGGYVAIAYATRHPEHPSKLILSSTRAAAHRHVDRSIELFVRFGGEGVRDLVTDQLTRGFSPERVADWMSHAMPLYNRRAQRDSDAAARSIRSTRTLVEFSKGEGMRFDMLADLDRIQCPTLVLGGEDDPMTPIEDQEDIVAALPPHLVRFERFANSGHGAYRDDPAAVFPIVREFILS
jgi:pimeloyl-ACP methyl ester carboxylesterase